MTYRQNDGHGGGINVVIDWIDYILPVLFIVTVSAVCIIKAIKKK